MSRVACVLLCIPVFLFVLTCSAMAANDGGALQKGIAFYKDESYEEAVQMLEEARKEQPDSSVAAFFLGMAYKQVMDFDNAAKHLRDAVTIRPGIKEGVIELAAVLFRTGHLDEALKWVDVALEQGFTPAKAHFLKGLIFQKQGEHEKAVESFQKAAELDETYRQSAEFQIALSYIRARDLQKARERLSSAVLLDPDTDLAAYARQYQDVVERRIELEKPFHFTLSLFGQYDSNVLLKPSRAEDAPGIEEEDSFVLATSGTVDFTPRFESHYLFSAQYSISANFHDNYGTTYDLIGQSISLSPGYDFGWFSANAVGRYSNTLKRDGAYELYLEELSAGGQLRKFVAQNHLFEFYGGYFSREYDEPPLLEADDRDSIGYTASLSWLWLYTEGGFFNARYEYTDEDAVGRNMDYRGNRFSLAATYPLAEKLKLQLSGSVYLQDYKNHRTGTPYYPDIRRDDDTYDGTVGLTYEFYKNAQWILQYTRTQAYSNLPIYDYERDVYTTGIEYRF